MKKLYAIFVLAFSVSFANAAIIPIQVLATSFSPATATAQCGDTVVWVLQSGSHTTTSTTIPGCATAWNAPIAISSPTFAITVPCAGTYNYKCTPHGFTGTIVVTCSNAVPSIDLNFVSTVYPNPFNTKITIEAPVADMITFYNMVGEKIKSVALKNGQTKIDVDVPELTQGIYFYSLLKEGVIVETRKLVKN